jgi:putative transposase
VSRLIARDAPVVAPLRTLAAQYPRYGYRTIRIFLERQGHVMGTDRMYRLWRQEGLQVPKKRPRRRVAASRPRPLPPTAINHVWAYDFVFDTCADGRALKCLTVIDEFTRECLAIDVAGGIRSGRVIEVLTQLVSMHGAPKYLRSDNGLPQKSRRQSFSDLTPWSVETDARRQAVPPVRNHTLTIVTQGQRSCRLP